MPNLHVIFALSWLVVMVMGIDTNRELDYDGFVMKGGAIGEEDIEEDIFGDRLFMGGFNKCSQCGSSCRSKCGTRAFRGCCLRLMRKRKPNLEYPSEVNGVF